MKKLILKTQANEVFNSIKDLDIDPSEFEWQEIESNTPDGEYFDVSKLVHVPTGYYFIFDYDYESHYGTRSPGGGRAVESRETEHWYKQLEYAKTWLRSLKKQIDAPDLWTTIIKEKDLIITALDNRITNSTFNNKEKSNLALRIKELEEYIKNTYVLSTDQISLLNNKLEYLIEASERQGKKDWLHTAIGVLFTIIIGLSLAPEESRDLFQFASDIIKQIIEGTLKALN